MIPITEQKDTRTKEEKMDEVNAILRMVAEKRGCKVSDLQWRRDKYGYIHIRKRKQKMTVSEFLKTPDVHPLTEGKPFIPVIMRAIPPDIELTDINEWIQKNVQKETNNYTKEELQEQANLQADALVKDIERNGYRPGCCI